MTVIALQGKSNTGKTTTLMFLYDKMIINGYRVLRIKKSRKDFCCILEKDGKRIGLTTRGDSASDIIRDFDYIITENSKILPHKDIDKFICAVHTSGETVKCVKSIAGCSFYKIYSKMTIESNITAAAILERQANIYQADFLYSEI